MRETIRLNALQFITVVSLTSVLSIGTVQAFDSLVRSHEDTVRGCGVGNYLFRHLKDCGVAPVAEVAPAAAPVAAAPAPVAPAKKAVITRSEIRITEEVRFETGKSVLSPEGKSVLDDVASVIRDHEKQIKSIEVGGHTDHTGSAAKNSALSEHRAEAVKSYLVDHGVNAQILHTKGYGQTQPKFDPKTSKRAEWQKNRRVEFKLTQ